MTISEKLMRETYIKAFGREFDSQERKHPPLPIQLAYEIALKILQVLELKKQED